MRQALAFTTLILAAAVPAQIPLPPYSSTFASSIATRGFYFQTPVNIVITGLRVPDEKNHGLQNVEVYKMSVAPPAYPATASGGQVFYMTGVPSSQIIPCSLSFNAGDYVGVLGACGDTSIMNNSYGAGNFASNVLGNPITLIRFLTQTNLVSSGGNQPYSTENASIARVEVYVAGQSAAIDYGKGAGLQNPAPTLTTTALPILGKTATLSLSQSDPTNQGGALLVGSGRASIPILQGTLYVNPPLFLTLSLPMLTVGATPINLGIPNNTALVGLQLNFQGVVAVLPAGVTMTNGTEWFVGY